MTLKNTRRLGVKNGTRGTVESVDEVRREVTIRRDDGTAITLPRSYLEAGHLTHAYAMTGHKAQGMTTDKAYVLGDQTLYREWTYVAMSRGRNDNRLYVVAGSTRTATTSVARLARSRTHSRSWSRGRTEPRQGSGTRLVRARRDPQHDDVGAPSAVGGNAEVRGRHAPSKSGHGGRWTPNDSDLKR